MHYVESERIASPAQHPVVEGTLDPNVLLTTAFPRTAPGPFLGASSPGTLWGESNEEKASLIDLTRDLPRLQLVLANDEQTRFANDLVTHFHYLHAPVDVRCSLLAYLVSLEGYVIGCLLFGRPEATKVGRWYGSVAEKQQGLCARSRWEMLNLSRIWFDPAVQEGGSWHLPNVLPGFYDRQGKWHSRLASTAIEMALNAVVVDYLVSYSPVWTDEPYQLAEVLSYCNQKYHRGALYQQAGFHLIRTNGHGLQTYARTLRPLTQGEDAFICFLAEHSPRSIRLRAQREASLWQQQMLPLL